MWGSSKHSSNARIVGPNPEKFAAKAGSDKSNEKSPLEYSHLRNFMVTAAFKIRFANAGCTKKSALHRENSEPSLVLTARNNRVSGAILHKIRHFKEPVL